MRYGRILAILTLILVGWMPRAEAAPGWFVCEVNATGIANNEDVFVRLSDTAGSPAFTNKWFRANQAVANEMLATALSAITAGLKLQVRTDPDDGSAPFIQNMYVRD